MTNKQIFAIFNNMDKVISIYEAKTNLSKLVKKAKAGQTIYIGAYGKPEAVISPLPQKKAGIKFGSMPGVFENFDFDEFQALDKEIKWDI